MKRLFSMSAAASCLLGVVSLAHCSSPPTAINKAPDGGFAPDAGDGGPNLADAGVDAGGLTPDAGTPASMALALLNQVATSMRAFHKDTGGWPQGNSVWYGDIPPWEMKMLPDGGTIPDYSPVEISPTPFTMSDVSLFTQAVDPVNNKTALPACGATVVQPCWSGPYLNFTGTALAAAMTMADVKDPWGNALLFAYIRPFDGFGGGVVCPDDQPNCPQQNGAIVIWSMGGDQQDETGCTTTGFNCSYNEFDVASGMASVSGADDIIVLVDTNTAITD